MKLTISRCRGCGITMQTDIEKAPGYVVASTLAKEDVVCQRCFQIRHYNKYQNVTQTEEECLQKLKVILRRPCLVLHLIDLLDISGSWLRDLAPLVRDQDFWVIGNKVDLLPTRFFPKRLVTKLRQDARAQGFKPRSVYLCSSRTGFGMDVIQELLCRAKTKHICVLGATNVGKSTWINRLLPENRYSTVSAYPGTTLDNVSINYHDKVIYDTPGVVKKDRLSDWLPAKDAVKVVPSEPLRPRIHHLAAGQTLFIGGLLRLDIEAGERQPCIVYVANRLLVHRTKQKNARLLWLQHRGKMLSPPTGALASKLTWHSRMISLTDRYRKDIVIAGLGFITVGGYTHGEIKVWFPEGISVSERITVLGKVNVCQEDG